jgi:hypothetical protein
VSKSKLSYFFIVVISFFFTACQKENVIENIISGNKVPVVNAGLNQTITLPVDSVTLTGSASDSDGFIVAYLWSQVSGPFFSTIVNPGSSTTKVKGLRQGTYVFQLMAIDNEGATGVDTASVLVNPSLIQTLTLQPTNNANEVYIHSLIPNGSTSGISQLTIAAWTAGGITHYWRTFIKFDYSAIPINATILNAKLSLYAAPTPFQGNGVDAHFGTSNACYIQRVTSNWNTASITWNNQPATVTTNQTIIPQSTSSFQNDIDLDVTSLVRDMQTNGNNGFAIRLQNEVIYNVRQYASSFDNNSSIHPRLVITYQ